MRRFVGMIAGIGTWLLAMAGRFAPDFVEAWYSRGFFQGIRRLLDGITGILPFPAVYLLVAGGMGYLGYSGTRLLRRRRLVWTGSLRRLGNGIGWIVAAFFWLWGFNYLRTPVEQTLDLDAAPLPFEQVVRALDVEFAQLIRLRGQWNLPEGAVPDASFLPMGLEASLRNTLERVLSDYGYPVNGQVRGRLLYPRGILLRFSTSGIYLPFTGEGHIDAGLHPIQLPFTMAHELAHGYGFGDEGVCNFWAYLTCMRSAHPFIRYSGSMGYWRYLASAYRRADPEGFLSWRNTWPAGITSDLKAIQEAMDRYPDLVPELQYQVYDQYLKTQGVKAGMRSYSQVLRLVEAWKARQH